MEHQENLTKKRLRELLALHQHEYDLDWDRDFGCSCGRRYGEEEDYGLCWGRVNPDAHTNHLAAVVFEELFGDG